MLQLKPLGDVSGCQQKRQNMVQCIVDDVNCILCTAYSILNTEHLKLYTVYITLYTVEFVPELLKAEVVKSHDYAIFSRICAKF